MARFHGIVGFAKSVEDPAGSGIWQDKIITRAYNGDILKNARRWVSADKINDDLNISNQFSIVADSFILENLYAMKYLEYMGTKWKITDVSIERPRIILSIGGMYNE